jgi:hypothetical protein
MPREEMMCPKNSSSSANSIDLDLEANNPASRSASRMRRT